MGERLAILQCSKSVGQWFKVWLADMYERHSSGVDTEAVSLSSSTDWMMEWSSPFSDSQHCHLKGP